MFSSPYSHIEAYVNPYCNVTLQSILILACVKLDIAAVRCHFGLFDQVLDIGQTAYNMVAVRNKAASQTRARRPG